MMHGQQNVKNSLLVIQIEEKSNQLEVTLCYNPGNPEEGETDSLTIGVTKLRLSIAATRECEQKNGVYSCSFVCIIKMLRVFCNESNVSFVSPCSSTCINKDRVTSQQIWILISTAVQVGNFHLRSFTSLSYNPFFKPM